MILTIYIIYTREESRETESVTPEPCMKVADKTASYEAPALKPLGRGGLKNTILL